MPATRELEGTDTFRFRTTQGNVDYLTAFALLDDTTIGHQARLAIDEFLREPGERDAPIEPRKLIRTLEMRLEPEKTSSLGAVAVERFTSVDQTLHDAFKQYFSSRFNSPFWPAQEARIMQQVAPRPPEES